MMKRSTPMKRAASVQISPSDTLSVKVPVKEAKPPRGPRPRKCGNKACRAPFVPFRSLESWCSPECGAVIALEKAARQKAKEQRAERAETKAKLKQYKPLSYWLAIAERHCNAFIRARDPDECISCGVRQSSAWQAGHYISVGANCSIRFHQDNINKQCIKCNMELGGNAIQYRIGLIAKIGIERVEWLESWHPPIKMTAEYALEVAATYRAKLKELKGKA